MLVCRSRRRLWRPLISGLLLVCLLVVMADLGLPVDEQQSELVSARDLSEQTGTGWPSLPLRTLWMENRAKAAAIEVPMPSSGPDVWRRANPDSKKYKLLVYSAFFDNRTQPGCVRVIGTTLTKKSPKVVCRVRLKSGDLIVIHAQKKPLNEHWNLLYAGFFFSCCSRQFRSSAPEVVSVFEETSSNMSVSLYVHRNQEDSPSPIGEFALCVKPLHYNFNRAVQLLEFVEFYKLQGVEHFLFYNDSVGPEVQRILLNYQEKKMVTILPWSMDVENQKEIRTENMFSALNDCIYRLMYFFKYVVSVDLDEFMVPKSQDNLTSMISSLSKERKGAACVSSYVIQNAFFYLYWENDTTLFGVEPETYPRYVPYLLTQYKTRRLEKPHVHGKRSKYIAVPITTLEAGNHVTWRHIGGCKPVQVNSATALMHHYRICEYGGFDCTKAPSVVDRTALRFGLDLMTRVLRRCYQVFPQIFGQCPLSPPLGSPW